MISHNDLATIAYSLFRDGGFDIESARRTLSLLSRKELARFVLHFEKALMKRAVVITSSNELPRAIRVRIEAMFPGKYFFFNEEPGSGEGISVTSGDNRIDLTVRGYIERVFIEAGKA
jgi:hypothetical protein